MTLNGDNFSATTKLKNTPSGQPTSFTFQREKPKSLEVSIRSINEYRYGGEMVDNLPLGHSNPED